MSTYEVIFGVLAVALTGSLVVKAVRQRNEGAAGTGTAEFRSFQHGFILVYLFATAADWLQGAYVFRLYDYYGFTREQNGILFLTGYAASMLLGTFCGPLADLYGRRNACVAYGVLYTLSCLTKFVNSFPLLLFGRVLGGIATSLLWSAFESWLVSEHFRRGFSEALLGRTFSLMATLNSVVAVVSGVVSQMAVDYFGGSPAVPFALSIACLIPTIVLVQCTFTENYGDSLNRLSTQVKQSLHTLQSDKRTLFTGLQQVFFESAMYVFVFLWTPALAVEGGNDIPHGLIFSCFMLACGLGGSVSGFSLERTVRIVTYVLYSLSAGTMLLSASTTNPTHLMIVFVLYEAVVGAYWPTISTLRSAYVPEGERATITNLFRVPLNLIVCVILYVQGHQASISSVYNICFVLNLGGVGAAYALDRVVQKEKVLPDETSELVSAPPPAGAGSQTVAAVAGPTSTGTMMTDGPTSGMGTRVAVCTEHEIV